MYKIINKKKRIVTICLDSLGKLLFLPRTLFRRQDKTDYAAIKSTKKIKKICIIRTAYIGDVVMTLPMLPSLRKRFPDAIITFLTSTAAAPLLLENPSIDEVLTFDPFWFYPASIKSWLCFIKKIQKKSFDLVVETRGDIRELALIVFWIRSRYKVSYGTGGGVYLLTDTIPWPGNLHKVELHLNMINFLGGTAQLSEEERYVYISESEYDTVSLLLEDRGVSGSFIAVHPGSRLKLKQWFSQRFALVCDTLTLRFKMPIVLVGSSKERALTADIQELSAHPLIELSGELDIRQLAALLSLARLFICNDSGPMHIASAVNTPTVALFGPSKSIETGPWSAGNCHTVIEKEYPCRYSCDESHCHNPEYHGCMQQIAVDDVLAGVEDVWKRFIQDDEILRYSKNKC